MFLGEIPWIWALEFMNESESHWKLCCVIKLCCWFTYSLWNVQCLLWHYQRVVKQRLYRYLRVDIQILYGQKIWLLYLTINLKLCRYGRKMGKEQTKSRSGFSPSSLNLITINKHGFVGTIRGEILRSCVLFRLTLRSVGISGTYLSEQPPSPYLPPFCFLVSIAIVSRIFLRSRGQESQSYAA